MDFTQLLQGPLKEVILSQTTSQLNIDNKQQANSALDSIIATLMNAVSNNASSPAGATSLMNALDRDHDGSIFNDLAGFLSGASTPSNPNTTNGRGILDHLLGDKKESAVEDISKSTGIDSSKIMQMMISLAPIVLGMLGKAKAEPKVQESEGGLLDYIKGATKTANEQPQSTNIFTKFLDKDGDGSIIDDVANMGMKSIFNRFLGKK